MGVKETSELETWRRFGHVAPVIVSPVIGHGLAPDRAANERRDPHMPASLSRRQFIALASSAAGVLGLGLAGCGSGSGSSSSGETSSSSAAASDGAGSYIVAMDTVFAPFEYTDEGGNFVGIDVDLLDAIAADQGIAIDKQSLGFDAALAALQAGQADAVMAGMGINDERKKKYDFSDPYFLSTTCIACKAGVGLEGIDAIRDKKAAVKTGSQGAEWAESLKEDYNLTLAYFDTSDLMYQDVLTGNSDLCFEYYPVIDYGCKHDNGLAIVYKNPENTNSCGFAVQKGQNAELLEKFNAGLANLHASGEYDKIVAKYID